MKITDIEHDQFILASSDDNQVHVDIAVAQSLGANSRIIHGIHQIFFLMNKLCISENEISEFKFNFIKPLSVNQHFEISYHQNGNKISFSIEDSITQFTSGYFLLEVKEDISIKGVKAENISITKERSLSLVTSNIMKFDLINLKKLYPRIGTAFTEEFLHRLLYISFYFGVIIRSENMVIISVQFKTAKITQDTEMHTVQKRTGQAQVLKINFAGKTLMANGKKYNRYNLIGSSLRSNLNVGRYGGQKALVFGGTGSLGSAISRILLRDQSQVNVTFRSLEKLNQVFDQKLENLTSWEYDLDSSSLPDLEDITHIYFLLTPRIFISNKQLFSEVAYDEFYKYYVTTIQEIIDKYTKGPLKYIFSPSTIALNQPSLQLKEYIKAKQEMESQLLKYSSLYTHLTISFPRLEVFDSLQTSNIPPHAKKLPEEVAYRYLPFTS